MKNLNLEKLHQVCNKLSNKQDELAGDNVYVSLMGVRSNYCNTSFEQFLEYYSFRFEEKYILVFNDDLIPWEDYSVGDFSYILIELLEISEEDLDLWIDEEVDKQMYLEKLNKRTNKTTNKTVRIMTETQELISKLDEFAFGERDENNPHLELTRREIRMILELTY